MLYHGAMGFVLAYNMLLVLDDNRPPTITHLLGLIPFLSVAVLICSLTKKCAI